jgi:hypothetical protein
MLQLHRQLKRLALDGRERYDTLAVCLVSDGQVQVSKGKASTGSTIVLDKASFHHLWYINEACLAPAAPCDP